jgi:endonuclease III
MTSGFRFAPGGRQRLRLLDGLLDTAYGAPETILGNQPNVLDEAVYIILSFQTDLQRFRHTWQGLRSAFPQWADANRASVDEIADVLRAGGLHRQKANTIKRLLGAVRIGFGEFSLDALRELGDADAERLLTRLPGLSWKGARCVLLYSLQRDVFPVDGNTFRILRRAGVIPGSAVYRRRSLHDALQAAVPAERRRQFHVNLVVHGQRACLPATPRCETCPVLTACERRGLAALAVHTDDTESRLDPLAGRPASQNEVPTSSRDTRLWGNGRWGSRAPGVRHISSAG